MISDDCQETTISIKTDLYGLTSMKITTYEVRSMTTGIEVTKIGDKVRQFLPPTRQETTRTLSIPPDLAQELLAVLKTYDTRVALEGTLIHEDRSLN